MGAGMGLAGAGMGLANATANAPLSAMDNIKNRLQSMIALQGTTNDRLFSFLDRAAGATPQGAATADKPMAVPNGSLQEINHLLDELEQRLNTAHDQSSRLATIA